MADKSLAANSKGTAKKKPRGRPWPKGVSGNPAGAPKRGESWAEVIKRVGELTPGEAAERSLELARKLLDIGEGVTLKEAVVLRVYASMLFDPDGRLWGQMMDRAEGKVAQPTVNMTWQEYLKQNGYDPAIVFEHLVRNAADLARSNVDRSMGSGTEDA